MSRPRDSYRYCAIVFAPVSSPIVTTEQVEPPGIQATGEKTPPDEQIIGARDELPLFQCDPRAA